MSTAIDGNALDKIEREAALMHDAGHAHVPLRLELVAALVALARKGLAVKA